MGFWRSQLSMYLFNKRPILVSALFQKMPPKKLACRTYLCDYNHGLCTECSISSGRNIEQTDLEFINSTAGMTERTPTVSY